jgi:hypothetical protein
MENFIDAFKRNADGSWSCIRDVTLNGPSGRIQVLAGTTFHRGKIFMGVDLASFLETQSGSSAPAEELKSAGRG